MRNSILSTLLLFLGFTFISQAQSPTISEEIKNNIKARVDYGINTGIVVGIVTSKGTEYHSYGVKSFETEEKVDENSIFEIGSITKTFTGLLLADAVVKRELNLDDPIQNLLPNGINAPTKNGESIKLFHLSNHTSSLARLPGNLTISNPSNPYGDYSVEQMYEFLNTYELPRAIGSQFEYSNYAVGLLGNILAAKSKSSYEELMVDIIAKPLGMGNTRIVLTPEMKKNLAFGHSNGVQVENWDLPTLAGAGAIRSSALDMAKYLSANMGIVTTNLFPALELTHKISSGDSIKQKVGLGWIIEEKNDSKIIWHNGATGGYRAFTGFIKNGDYGVIVLTNSAAPITDLGMYMLDSSKTLIQPKPSISLEMRKLLDNKSIKKATKSYWNISENEKDQYNFEENELNSLGYFYIQKNEIDKAVAVLALNVQAYPESFNAYDSYAEALMLNNENKKAIANYKKSLELFPGNTNGIEMLKKLGVDTKEFEKEVKIASATLKSYVGNYELVPGFILTITKEGNQLIAQATGQGANPIYPSSENEFYLKVVDAQIVFNRNEAGEVESLTLFQAGQELVGKKNKD
ncbi:serine hydrolase [Brumimicrobium mesophilum]|uniref:serine hydrolase n=1 Tax=Brumimicrobium mesophilum TaxID=392717 RepID=UPI000D143FDE|nr:serine hydrolase [Brumimicrobium mesophilum]